MESSGIEGRTRGERTRATLIDAARARFATLGFDGALGADIAADAGVSEPSIGFHFGSKRGLFLAVMETYYERTQAEIDDVIDLDLDPVARLGAFTRWWIDHLAAHRDLIAEFEHQARPGRMGDDVTETYLRLHGRFTRFWVGMIDQLKAVGFLRTDIDSRVMLETFAGATRQVVGDDPTDAATHDAEHVQQLLELVLTGAAATPNRAATREPALTDLDHKLDQILERLDQGDHAELAGR